MPLGIDNLKKLLKTGLDLGQELAKDLKDNKISIMEGAGLVDNVFASIGVAKSWKYTEAELKDLTIDETSELEEYAMSEFNIPNEKVKTFVRHSLRQVISLAELVDEFKHINDPVVQP